MTWSVIAGRDNRQHVVPNDDMRKHRHSIDCWCRPMIDTEDEGVMIHNAMDRREQFEGKALQ